MIVVVISINSHSYLGNGKSKNETFALNSCYFICTALSIATSQSTRRSTLIAPQTMPFSWVSLHSAMVTATAAGLKFKSQNTTRMEIGARLALPSPAINANATSSS